MNNQVETVTAVGSFRGSNIYVVKDAGNEIKYPLMLNEKQWEVFQMMIEKYLSIGKAAK